MREEMTVCDPVELVKELADKIGINQLYVITKDLRGEDTAEDRLSLRKENEDLKNHLQYMELQREHDRGMIEGLQFAIRCDGVSGSEVRE